MSNIKDLAPNSPSVEQVSKDELCRHQLDFDICIRCMRDELGRLRELIINWKHCRPTIVGSEVALIQEAERLETRA